VLGGGDGRQLLDLTPAERRRIFNLGYFTWVEQQGVPFDAFVERREPGFWHDLQELLPAWDGLIDAFNDRVARASGRASVPA
jgi:hypothetical protein